MQELIRELRRRRVFRTAGLYIVGTWLVLQVADLAFESWGLPGETLRFVWIAAALLFPLALVFGWRYDLTAQGLVRTPAGAAPADLSLKAWDYVILASLAVMAAASSWLVYSDFATSGLGGDMAQGAAAPTAARTIVDHSIAVLPFVTRASGEEARFFADGVHDDLLTTLANVGALKVISRTSVMEYRDSSKKIPQIALELGVAHILEGGVQAAGDQVRINVQLIDARSDDHLWAQTYDRRLSVDNLFAIQSEIVQTIADQLAAALSPVERRRIDARPTDNLDAFREYARGRIEFAHSTFSALRLAVAHYSSAIELDPDFAQARVGLAHAYHQLAHTGAITVQEMFRLGQTHIDRAIELDAGSAYAQAVLARYEADAGAQGAEDRFTRALALNPNSIEATGIYAKWLRDQERHETAVELLGRALELDPLNVTLLHDRAYSLIALGAFEPAHADLTRMEQIDPENPFKVHGFSMITAMTGQAVEAGYWSDQGMALDPNDYEIPSSSAIFYASAGLSELARRRIDQALEIGPGEPYPLAVQAVLNVLDGREEQALASARSALANGLEDRWGSDYVMLRVVRDEALRQGSFGEALGFYRRALPEGFAATPNINPANIAKLADLGPLLLASGDEVHGRQLLESVIDQYAALYTRGSVNYPMKLASVDALVALGRHDEAVAELKRLVADGFRIMWRFSTRLNPVHEPLQSREDYQAILQTIEADMAAQRKAGAALLEEVQALVGGGAVE